LGLEIRHLLESNDSIILLEKRNISNNIEGYLFVYKKEYYSELSQEFKEKIQQKVYFDNIFNESTELQIYLNSSLDDILSVGLAISSFVSEDSRIYKLNRNISHFENKTKITLYDKISSIISIDQINDVVFQKENEDLFVYLKF